MLAENQNFAGYMRSWAASATEILCPDGQQTKIR